MKKLFLVVFGLITGLSLMSSCTPRGWFLVNSNGIATYNRTTGQFEVLWENVASRPVVVHDTIYVQPIDSIRQ